MKAARTGPYRGIVPVGASPVRVTLASCDRKLAPVVLGEFSGDRQRPTPVGPFVVATYVAIAPTCPSTCQFKAAGCYVTAGFTGRSNRLLEQAAEELSGDEVCAREAEVLDGLFGNAGGRVPQDGGRDGKSGRDLRLHTGGDTSSTRAARRLALTARRWRERGGGVVWSYTHRWRAIARRAFGEISILASVETFAEAARAWARGYAPAIVVDAHPEDGRAWSHGALRVVPCPAETRGATCVECRLCLDADGLHERKTVIAFALHGAQRARVHLRVEQGDHA
jgi:hypothetical protein